VLERRRVDSGEAVEAVVGEWNWMCLDLVRAGAQKRTARGTCKPERQSLGADAAAPADLRFDGTESAFLHRN
jgi:hypothetical protein